jgi:hypothetical protein
LVKKRPSDNVCTNFTRSHFYLGKRQPQLSIGSKNGFFCLAKRGQKTLWVSAFERFFCSNSSKDSKFVFEALSVVGAVDARTYSWEGESTGVRGLAGGEFYVLLLYIVMKPHHLQYLLLVAGLLQIVQGFAGAIVSEMAGRGRGGVGGNMCDCGRHSGGTG